MTRTLRAEVRDPVWMLTRQWQMGEYRGEDAASPAYVQFEAAFSRIDRWSDRTGEMHEYDGAAPLETLTQGDAFTPDLTTAVELGNRFERLLAKHGAPPAAASAFRSAYPMPTPAEATDEHERDPTTLQFLRVCGGRAIHGAALLGDVLASGLGIPTGVTPPPGSETAIEATIAEFVEWVGQVYGTIGTDDGAAWNPQRLGYEARIYGTSPAGQRVGLTGEPGLHGEFDWYAFDESGQADDRVPSSDDVERLSESILPMGIRFPGLPKKRWWEFEDAQFNLAEVHMDGREIAKALWLDFMLIHANDWFAVPMMQRVGSMCHIDNLLVHDVFGDATLIERADRTDASGWTIFSTSTDDENEHIADYFVLPPTSSSMSLHGQEIEHVRFFRDETANMVWAVEHTLESPIGRRQDGRERARSFDVEPPPPPPTEAPVRYELQTTVPAHWIPFVPVQIDTARRSVALERAAMRKVTPGGVMLVEPAGRILRPSTIPPTEPYRVREEEITRSGLEVTRQVRYSRWIDGSSHIWVARKRGSGMGEGGSGLRFDVAASTVTDEA